MRSRYGRTICLLPLLLTLAHSAEVPRPLKPNEDVLVTQGEIGQPGGRLVASLRSGPKTLNPVIAIDQASKDVIALLFADLVHINLYTQKTGPALAKSWKVSPDGRRYTLELRRGIFFSDGHPFSADDVVFSFRVYMDEKVHSPQRDLLLVGGKPIRVEKLGPYRILIEFPQPYAAAERLFDSVQVLPRHLLERAYEQGKISQSWGLATGPGEIAGLGPFRLKQYIPGQQLLLERNPFYWKADASNHRLPYLDEIAFLIVPTADAEVIRFQAGEVDVISNLSAENFAMLEKDSTRHRVYDLGPGMEYDFLFFNLNDLSAKKLPEISQKQEWFRDIGFRQAISAAIDRDAIVRLVYQGRATPLWHHVTPGNKHWLDASIPRPPRSLDKAMALLHAAGFNRSKDGLLLDAHAHPVEFSLLVNPSNAQRNKIATIIQDDLTQLGMKVHLVPLEFQALMTRVFDSFEYEACILGLVSGDADPNPEINVWTSGGGTHIWAPAEVRPATPWQAELDRLMQLQTTVLDYKKRKRVYDRVQEIVAESEPVVCLVGPNVLVGAKASLGGVQPSVMRNYMLWNAEQLFWRQERASSR